MVIRITARPAVMLRNALSRSGGRRMTHEDVMQMLAETEIPFAYDHFAEGESPDPPFICFLFSDSENFAADNVVYMICRRALMRTILKTPLWILFRWSCSRISAASWRSMRILRVVRIRQMSGWISSEHFPFIRCFRRSSNFGD